MIVNSRCYYGGFQHSEKKIPAGDISANFEHGLIRLKQEAIGLKNEIAFHPNQVWNIIEALKKAYMDYVREIENG